MCFLQELARIASIARRSISSAPPLHPRTSLSRSISEHSRENSISSPRNLSISQITQATAQMSVQTTSTTSTSASTSTSTPTTSTERPPSPMTPLHLMTQPTNTPPTINIAPQYNILTLERGMLCYVISCLAVSRDAW